MYIPLYTYRIIYLFFCETFQAVRDAPILFVYDVKIDDQLWKVLREQCRSWPNASLYAVSFRKAAADDESVSVESAARNGIFLLLPGSMPATNISDSPIYAHSWTVLQRNRILGQIVPRLRLHITENGGVNCVKLREMREFLENDGQLHFLRHDAHMIENSIDQRWAASHFWVVHSVSSNTTITKDLLDKKLGGKIDKSQFVLCDTSFRFCVFVFS